MRSVTISAHQLAQRIGEVSVLDVRWQLGRTDGAEQFRAGHVPGAAYVDLERELADPPAEPVDDRGRHPLPDPERFGEAMRRCGVSLDRPVVVMDGAGGMAAARCWWLLRHHGHDDVRLLDGGWTGWQESGLPVESGEAVVAPGDFTPGPGRLRVVGPDGASEIAASGVLLDARAPGRFRGEEEPVDPVAGHVPGSRSVPATGNLTEVGSVLRPEAELRELYGEALDAARDGKPVGVSCGSGVTAALSALALHALGVEAVLYEGSWSGWVSDRSRPVATGSS